MSKYANENKAAVLIMQICHTAYFEIKNTRCRSDKERQTQGTLKAAGAQAVGMINTRFFSATRGAAQPAKDNFSDCHCQLFVLSH